MPAGRRIAHPSGVTNGPPEAINSLTQSTKARGFRNIRYLITMVYFIAGNWASSYRRSPSSPTRNSEGAVLFAEGLDGWPLLQYGSATCRQYLQ